MINYTFCNLFCIFLLTIYSCSARKGNFSGSIKKDINHLHQSLINLNPDNYYVCMSQKLRNLKNKESIKKHMEENPREYEEIGMKIKNAKDITISGILHTGDGKELIFILENDRWKLHQAPFISSGSFTPFETCKKLAETLKLFLTVLQKQTNIFGKKFIEILIEPVETMAAELANIDPNSIIINDDRAYLALPSGRRIEMKKEINQWKVTNIIPVPVK